MGVCWRELIMKGSNCPIFLSMVTILMLLSFTVGDNFLPNGECSIQNAQCEVHQNNLITVHNGIPLIGECRDLCFQEPECSHFTFYGLGGAPFISVCFLYSACSELDLCHGCETEKLNCSALCGRSFTGQMVQENTISYLADIISEENCESECRDLSECAAYTYYTGTSSFLPFLCVLQSQLLGPFEDCDNCMTGPRSCNECSFELTETSKDQTSASLEHNLFTSSGNIYFDPLVYMFPDNCLMHVVAVGGGGEGLYSSTGGGGSGYVVEEVLQINTSSYAINVGGHSSDSSVNDLDSGLTVVLAGVGGSESYTSEPNLGGDGYCGGGQADSQGYPGGSDGSDGGGSNGGRGSGFDVSTLILFNYVLSPGIGGEPSSAAGGGGGGVLVNGEGPQARSQQGEGYGGGGWGTSGSNSYGNPGMIILEVYPKSQRNILKH